MEQKGLLPKEKNYILCVEGPNKIKVALNEKVGERGRESSACLDNSGVAFRECLSILFLQKYLPPEQDLLAVYISVSCFFACQ